MFTEDLASFFADFAVPCTVGGVAVRAIFDDAGALGSVGVAGMATSQPTVTVPSADLPADPYGLPADPYGLPVQVGVRNYVVAATEHDGTGITRLLLEASA